MELHDVIYICVSLCMTFAELRHCQEQHLKMKGTFDLPQMPKNLCSRFIFSILLEHGLSAWYIWPIFALLQIEHVYSSDAIIDFIAPLSLDVSYIFETCFKAADFREGGFSDGFLRNKKQLIAVQSQVPNFTKLYAAKTLAETLPYLARKFYAWNYFSASIYGNSLSVQYVEDLEAHCPLDWHISTL